MKLQTLWAKLTSLRITMMLIVVAVVVTGFAVTVKTITDMAGQMQREQAEQMAGELAEKNAAIIKSQLDKGLQTARAFADALKGLKASDNTDRDAVNAIMRRLIEENPDFLGVCTVWAPDAFDGEDKAHVKKTPGDDDTGRLIPYWTRAGGTVHLEANVDYEKPGAGDYYLVPKATGQDTVIEPYFYPMPDGSKKLITTLAVPVVVDGQFLGSAGVDMTLASFQDSVSRIHPYETGYATLVSNQGTVVADVDAGQIGKPYAGDDGKRILAAIRNGERDMVRTHDARLHADVYRVFVPVKIGATAWSFVVTLPMDKVMAGVTRLHDRAVQIATWLVVALSLILFLALHLLVNRPLRQAMRAAQRLSEGDLTATIRVRSRNEIGQLLTAIKTVADNLRDIMGQVRRATDTLTRTAGDLASGNADLNRRTEAQTLSLKETAERLQALTETVVRTAESSREAAALAQNASAVAARGGDDVRNVTQVMGEIQESSARIGEFVTLIRNIASQTNILSLNATIEAARAGQHGKGFAVVAMEVRSLAQRTTAAAAEIQKLIQESATRVEEGARLSQAAGSTMGDIVESVNRVDRIIATISAGASEQSRDISQLNQAMESMDEVTHKNAALVEEVAGSAASLTAQTEALARSVSLFKLGGDARPGGPVRAPAPGVAAHAGMARRPAAPARAPAPARKQAPAAAAGQARSAAPVRPAAASRPAVAVRPAAPAGTPARPGFPAPGKIPAPGGAARPGGNAPAAGRGAAARPPMAAPRSAVADRQPGQAAGNSRPAGPAEDRTPGRTVKLPQPGWKGFAAGAPAPSVRVAKPGARTPAAPPIGRTPRASPGGPEESLFVPFGRDEAMALNAEAAPGAQRPGAGRRPPPGLNAPAGR